MKKLLTIFTAFLLLVGCAPASKSDALLFKEEYESLNHQKDEQGKEYVTVEIPENNPMVYASADEIVEHLKEDAIFYFGFDECPWCRSALSVFIEACNELDVEKVYYFNIKEGRDVLKLKDGKIEVEKEKSEDYKKIYDALYDVLPVYDGLNDDSIKRLYAPTMLFVKNGEVVGLHESTVESHSDPYVEMSDSQKEELKSIYKQYISKVNSSICNTKC